MFHRFAMVMKLILLLNLLVLMAISVSGQSAQDKVRQTAELFVAAYNSTDYARIEKEFNAQMSAAISSAQLKQFVDETHKGLGEIGKLGTPNFVAPSAAVFPAEFKGGKMNLLIAVDAQGKIAGLRISPPDAPKAKNTSRSQTKFALPFKGEWLIFWGGDAAAQNQHQDAPNQRFAFDVVKADENGKTHKGDGSKNEDYYAFGQEITAPADGVVTYVVDGIHDNLPGEMNRMFVPGNTVIIKHADGEYSLFAHFKQNSIRVKVGDKAAKGQTLGLCGNSGNSSEVHLHFQVQNTPFFSDEASIKVFFEKITVKASGQTQVKTDYSPVKSDVVSN